MNCIQVIVNADDFGMSRGITNGILLTYRFGILTSTSLMVNQPASEYAVEQLGAEEGLGVGVHLNICSGRPILPPPQVGTLVDSRGEFHNPSVLIQKLWRFQVSSNEVEAEFRAQIQWMKSRGLQPDHADSHQHMHLYPAAIRPFARAVALEGIKCVRAPRCTLWPRRIAAGGPHDGPISRRLLVQAYRASLQFAALRGFAMPHSRIGFSDHKHDHRDHSDIGQLWASTMDALPPGNFELACHPGISERGFSDHDRISGQREKELRSLTDSSLRQAVERNGIRLICYSDLAKCHATKNTTPEAQAA